MSGEYTATSIGTSYGPIDLLDPRPMFVEDQAQVVSRIRRWTGHGGQTPTTVMHHLLHTMHVLRFEMDITDPDIILAGGLHDLHEAFTNDISRPLKLAMRKLSGGASVFDEIESIAMESIRKRYAPHLTGRYPEVGEADARCLGYEAEILFGKGTAFQWGVEPALTGVVGEVTVERYLKALKTLGCRYVYRP